jgi:CO/xanthine dehydrogenase Mo-binding subunit
VKALGKVAMMGTSAAFANTIFHATAKHVRELPS